MARGSQGFVRQSSPNRGRRVEQPSVLNKFFSELQYSAAFGSESRKFAGGVWKKNQRTCEQRDHKNSVSDAAGAMDSFEQAILSSAVS